MNIKLNLSSDPYPGVPIKYGDKGNNVAKIQVWLNYLSKNYSPLTSLKIDGAFGNSTQNDVITYQTMFGLKQDGIVGEITWNSISGVYNAALKSNVVPIAPSYIGYALSQGSSGNTVKCIQYMLNVCGTNYPTIPPLVVDGNYGSKTTTSVKEYQKLKGLKQDGVVGQTTWSSLLTAYTNIMNGVKEKEVTQSRSAENSFTKSYKDEPVVTANDILDIVGSDDIMPVPEIEENLVKAANASVSDVFYQDDIDSLQADPYPGTPLRNGSSGPNVVKVQNWLNICAGVYSPLTQLIVDGKFGNKTQADVQTFQAMFGLTEDGVVGQNTWNKLVSVKDQILAGITPAITPRYTGPYSQGSSGNHVKCIQYMLNVCREFYPEIPQLVVDGNYGPKTANAVKIFQAIEGLKTDGVVGQNTWNSLLGVYTEIMNGRIPPPPNPDVYPGFPVQNGDSGPNVVKVQTWLNTISGYYSPIVPLTVDGKFGNKTQSDVQAFQAMFGLTEDGVVGQNTWNKMVAVKNALASGIITPITPRYTGPYSQGSSGNHVKCIQYMLNVCRTLYPSIPFLAVDGNYGSNTANAVRVFQGTQGLTQDGVVGSNTWSRLLAVYTNIINGVLTTSASAEFSEDDQAVATMAHFEFDTQTENDVAKDVVFDDVTPQQGEPYPGTPIRIGDRGPNVVRIQTWLNTVADFYSPVTKTTVDGIFGSKTQADVQTFQTMFGLTPDGVVGQNTWNQLVYVKDELATGVIIAITPKYAGPYRQGSTGNTVKCIQYMLNTCRESYPSIPELVVDGNYGPKTANSVRVYQAIFGLTQDGVVGPITWGSLLGVYTEIINGRIPPPPNPDVYPGFPIQFGDTGQYVVKIQTWLNIIAQAYSPITPTNVDGVFGAKTQADVITFQTMFGLPQDGIVGEVTWNKMVQVKNGVLNNKLIPITPIYSGPYGQGSSGNTVKCIQYMLNTCRTLYPQIPLLTVDGNYGPNTANAVRIYQGLFGFTQNGIVGINTWNSLLDTYTGIINGSTPVDPDVYPGTPIKIGDTGPNVIKIQTWLNTIADFYSPITKTTVDGVFGAKTQADVQTFQTMFGLTPDGIVGEATWNKLVLVKNELARDVITPITPIYNGPYQIGSTGNTVKCIQYMLNTCREFYPSIPELVVDGNFGQKTANSVSVYQAIFGLTQDGVVGPETWGSLLGVYTEIINGRIPPPPNPDVYPGFPIQFGDTGQYVVKIQTWLNIIAQAYSPITRTTVDGVFGAKTQADVITFQTMFGLPQNGIVAEATWNKMVQVKNGVLDGKLIPITPIYNGPYQQGSTGNTVKCIQYMLNTCRTRYSSIPLLTVDGNYGPNTANAVRIYQGLFGLSQNGVVGQTTWNSLLATYTAIINGSTPVDPDKYPGTPIRIGDSGPNVVKIQTWLNTVANFYSPVTTTTVDGIFGSKTQADVMTFQTMFGLTPDGVVGEETWDQLVLIKNDLALNIINPITPNYHGPYQLGSTGDTVRCIQYMLNTCRESYPSIPELVVDGNYGPNTAYAVGIYQAIFGLTQDGVVGPITWGSLLGVYTEIMNGRIPVPPDPDVYPGFPIQFGDTGQYVVKIQTWLNIIAQAYSPITRTNVDGVFGAKTQADVITFQTMFGLPQNGIVAEATWNKIVQVKNGVLNGKLIPITPIYNGPYQQGSTGNTVKCIQYMLNTCRTKYPSIPLLTVDGNFGPNTANAVRIYQGLFGLPQNGIVAQATWNSLLATYTAIINGSTPVDPDKYPGTPVRIGDTGPNVVKIQTWLNTVADFYSPVTKTNVDGIFGTKTQSDVRTFQTMFGLTADGVVGETTWNKLVQVKNSLAAGTVIPITPKYAGPYRQGSTGDTVRCIQYMLNVCRRRYPSIPLLTVDGNYGPNTANAVRIYQGLFGLNQDGVVGPNTWNSILITYTSIINGSTPTDPDKYPGTPVKLGDDNESVTKIQTWMKGICTHYTPLKDLDANGYFDVRTLNNTTAFQNLFDLQETGIVNENTWNALRFVYKSYTGGKIVPVIPNYPGSPLKMGSTGNSVKSAQYMLNVIAEVYPDMPILKVEGVYGSNTRNSVIAFQTRFGLMADGIIGMMTWNKIYDVYSAIIVG